MHFQKIIKRMTALAISAVLAMTLVACGGGSEPAATDAPTEGTVEDEKEAQEETDPAADEAGEAGSDETPDATSRAAGGLGESVAYPDLYSDLVYELWEDETADQFALADIDGDGIYELLACDSEGNFNQENTFIYAFYDGDLILLASVISGVDGASLSYSENNLIHMTGSITGMSDVYYGIYDGELIEEFRADVEYTFDDDGEEVPVYSINDSEVTEKEYITMLDEYNTENAPFVYIDYDGLNVMDYENGEFVQALQLAYLDIDGIIDELDSIAVG